VAACALVVSQVVVGAGKGDEAGWLRPHKSVGHNGGEFLRRRRNGTYRVPAVLPQVLLFVQAGSHGQRQIGQASFGH
jgi:hypothetical protein